MTAYEDGKKRYCEICASTYISYLDISRSTNGDIALLAKSIARIGNILLDAISGFKIPEEIKRNE